MLNIVTPITWNISGAEVVVQDILDQILPKMLPLAVTLLVWKAMKKFSVTWLTVGLIVLGIALHAVGIL